MNGQGLLLNLLSVKSGLAQLNLTLQPLCLYETTQLEEKQFNKPHATKLYRQIVEPLHYGRKFCARTTPAFSSAPISFSL